MLGSVLGELVAMFGITFVSKKILEATGKKTIAGVLALGGYSLTGVQAVKAITIIKDMVTKTTNKVVDSFDAGEIVDSAVTAIIDAFVNKIKGM